MTTTVAIFTSDIVSCTDRMDCYHLRDPNEDAENQKVTFIRDNLLSSLSSATKRIETLPNWTSRFVIQPCKIAHLGTWRKMVMRNRICSLMMGESGKVYNKWIEIITQIVICLVKLEHLTTLGYRCLRLWRTEAMEFWPILLVRKTLIHVVHLRRRIDVNTFGTVILIPVANPSKN